MSEAKHTTAPWEISDARSPDGYAWVVGGEGEGFGLIAEVVRDDDAALIAAAPELLVSLRFALKLLDQMPFVAASAEVEAMRAAIAKAEGR